MLKRLIIAAVVFGIVSFTGSSIAVGSAFAAGNAVLNENDRVVLHGNVHPKARAEFDEGQTDPSQPMKRMILLLKIAPEKDAALDQLLAEQQNSSSPNFHRWLTPEEFGQKFGRGEEDIATVKNWLIAQGFTIDKIAKAGTWINFSGRAADVERAFHTTMRDYRINGRLHHANSIDPSVPRAFSDLVAGPVALNNFRHKPMYAPPRPMTEGKLQPDYNESDGNHSLSPGDFSAIYNVDNVYNLGYDGTGVTIAIVGRTYPSSSISKWNTFRSTFGLPYNPPVVTFNGPNPGDQGAYDDLEADLDVEWSGAVAKGATINFVVSDSSGIADGVDLSAQYIVDQNLAPIMSISFGTCERNLLTPSTTFYRDLWRQAASQGITVFVVSGDTGAYDCTDNSGNPTGSKAVNGLASTPYNVAVGGTQFDDTSGSYWSTTNGAYGTSVLGYIPEVAWDDLSYQLATGGGASSTYNSKPDWQVCPGVPSSNARYLPDVSLNADLNIGYRVFTCTNGDSKPCKSPNWFVVGGTSAASPSMAGIMALIVQSMGGQRQGNVNSRFYQLGNAQYLGTSGANPVFHDITSGNNGLGTRFPGYSCAAGYDLATGLGSVDATNLFLAFQEGGYLRVTISPSDAVTAGAKWNVDGGTWQDSGMPVFGLTDGSHTVAFKTIAGWTTPINQTIDFVTGQEATASGTYKAMTSVADFTADTTQGQVPLTVHFTDKSSGAVTSWLWDFGDGTASSSQNPSHTYTGAGVYPVILSVNGPGGPSSKSQSNYITVSAPPPPSADFTATPTSGLAPLNVYFSAQSTGSVNTWKWNFGDGKTSTSQNPSHKYTKAGTYTVTLTVSGPSGTNAKTQTISVYTAPKANFKATPTSGLLPLTVNFTDKSTGTITGWSWDFGDQQTGTDRNPSHTYTTPGTYTVVLTATNPGGSSTKTISKCVTVYAPAVAGFTAAATTGVAPAAIGFSDTSTGTISKWKWNFGDGKTSTQRNPTHTYSKGGTFSVTLTVSGKGGTSTTTQSNLITVYVAPKASFVVKSVSVKVQVPASFTDKSTGIISAWLWDFGDGQTSTDQSPSHAYTTTGTYTVTLTTTGQGGTNSTKTGSIKVTQ